MSPLFRLWHYPSMGTHVSWSVILSVRDHPVGMPVVRTVTWDRPADWSRMRGSFEALQRLSIPKPSVRIEDAAVAWGDLAPLLQEARGFKTPFPGADPPVVSGRDVFGIEGFGSMAHLWLKWSGRGPSEWARMIEWVGRFRGLLVRSIQERTKEPARK